MLDSQVPPVVGMEGVGDVARRIDAGDAGRQVLIHHDAAVDVQSGLCRELDARRDADADDHEVGGLGPTSGEHDLLHRAVAPDAVTPVPSRSATPLSAWIRANTAPRSEPRTRCRATTPGSMRVTSAPIWRAEAATSVPIQPPTMTATRLADRTASARRIESSRFRR